MLPACEVVKDRCAAKAGSGKRVATHEVQGARHAWEYTVRTRARATYKDGDTSMEMQRGREAEMQRHRDMHKHTHRSIYMPTCS
eukprot:15439222-Alexandrium_andersonii.AAC.1